MNNRKSQDDRPLPDYFQGVEPPPRKPSRLRAAWEWFWEGWRDDDTWMGHLFRGGIYMLIVVIGALTVYWHIAEAGKPIPTLDWSSPDSLERFALMLGDR